MQTKHKLCKTQNEEIKSDIEDIKRTWRIYFKWLLADKAKDKNRLEPRRENKYDD